jgi:hypothetical protein
MRNTKKAAYARAIRLSRRQPNRTFFVVKKKVDLAANHYDHGYGVYAGDHPPIEGGCGVRAYLDGKGIGCRVWFRDLRTEED